MCSFQNKLLDGLVMKIPNLQSKGQFVIGYVTQTPKITRQALISSW